MLLKPNICFAFAPAGPVVRLPISLRKQEAAFLPGTKVQIFTLTLRWNFRKNIHSHHIHTHPANTLTKWVHIKHDSGVIYLWIIENILKNMIFCCKKWNWNNDRRLELKKKKKMISQEHIWVWWKDILLSLISRFNYQMFKYVCNWVNSIIDE